MGDEKSISYILCFISLLPAVMATVSYFSLHCWWSVAQDERNVGVIYLSLWKYRAYGNWGPLECNEEPFTDLSDDTCQAMDDARVNALNCAITCYVCVASLLAQGLLITKYPQACLLFISTSAIGFSFAVLSARSWGYVHSTFKEWNYENYDYNDDGSPGAVDHVVAESGWSMQIGTSVCLSILILVDIGVWMSARETIAASEYLALHPPSTQRTSLADIQRLSARMSLATSADQTGDYRNGGNTGNMAVAFPIATMEQQEPTITRIQPDSPLARSLSSDRNSYNQYQTPQSNPYYTPQTGPTPARGNPFEDSTLMSRSSLELTVREEKL